ncbi:hypothetical protein EV401DRAFT_2040751 [Pisolithus croceorrhizus]|nr:hypothetical protein EV401DRAFT_2040751 [Pisolithus croceorrhizus]
MHYSEDSSAKKLLVIAIWILGTIHVSFMCHVLYHYLIINYGVPTNLEYGVWFVSHPVSYVYPALEIWQDTISVHDQCNSIILCTCNTLPYDSLELVLETLLIGGQFVDLK